MKNTFAKSSMTLLAISFILNACALSQAADTLDPETNTEQVIEQQTRPIDWERANFDATTSTHSFEESDVRVQRTNPTAVPLLLPPGSITLSDTLPTFQQLSTPQLITDKRGYSAVIQAESFTILIDASNQTFVTDQQTSVVRQANFDGEYQSIANGGQVTIGRYGALYAIQLLCLQEAQLGCINERMVREIIASLVVNRFLP